MPDFSTVSRRQQHLSVTIRARPTTTGLHLLLDSTGIKMLGEGEWKTKNIAPIPSPVVHGVMTANATGDASVLPCLRDQIATDECYADWRLTANGTSTGPANTCWTCREKWRR